MNLKTRVLGATSALVLSGGMIAFAAPVANAVVTSTGSCTGSTTLTKLIPGLTDQTPAIKAVGAVTTDSVTLANNGGVCSNLGSRPGSSVPQPPGFVTPKAVSSALLGNSSCAQGASAKAADATNANAYSLNGKITTTMSQTYTDTISGLVKPYSTQAYISILGFSATAGPDVVDISGMVVLGLSVGSNVSGSLWENPAKTAVTPDKGYKNSGYRELTALQAINALGGCADGIPNNVQMPGAAAGSGIPQVLVGDGASPTFGSTATGLAFQQGE